MKITILYPQHPIEKYYIRIKPNTKKNIYTLCKKYNIYIYS